MRAQNPEIFQTAHAMRQFADAALGDGDSIVLVPTMGALHEGHLSLVRRARDFGGRVVVSIFVNPTQFGPTEDLATYPKQLATDLERLSDVGVDAVFAPSEQAMYPAGFATYVVPDTLASTLCGARRPGHFRGVCTVVALLFRITRCARAVFGEKDFQQLQIIRRMVRDLWLDVEIVAAKTQRETDGLAMSSRNAYLSPALRAEATCLHAALSQAQQRFAEGERAPQALVDAMRERLAQSPNARVDYVELVDPETLHPPLAAEANTRAMLAVYFGSTRLIDNAALV